MKRRLVALLQERRWDNIVLDGLYTGWALPTIKSYLQTQPRKSQLIYISHNHEETTRSLIARNYQGNLLTSAALLRDAHKATLLERRMVDHADIVTAVSPEDANRFGARHAEKSILVLSPGYAGRRVDTRHIGPHLPRRVLLVGSFEWLAKQMNLREFLAQADGLFASAGVELQIVGNGDQAFFDGLKPGLKSTEIIGPVDNLNPYFDQARIAIIPERSGGGFKLKVLEYIFNRLPVAALENSIAGLPLARDKYVMTFPDYRKLATGAIEAIDDFDLLNRLQEEAFSVCANAFDWAMRGQHLMSALTTTARQPEPLKLDNVVLELAR
jgi:glycosyltransferase involved in cell wall biosynthesis